MKTILENTGLTLPELIGSVILMTSFSVAFLALITWADQFISIFIGG